MVGTNFSANARWMDSKYSGYCRECESCVYEGDRVVFIPNERGVYCDNCGTDVAGEDPIKHRKGVAAKLI